MAGPHEDEEVEEVEVDESTKAKPKRRAPRRAASTDGSPIPVRRGPPRAKSTNEPVLRRTRTDGTERKGRMPANKKPDAGTDSSKINMGSSSRDVEGSSPKKVMVPKRRIGRAKSGDGVGRFLPGRTKSGTNASIGPGRSAPKRTGSTFGRSTPRRGKSFDGTTSGSTFASLRKGRKKEKAGATEESLNIFGSDMVSAETILEDIENAKLNENLSKLELEDFFMAERADPEIIATALADLFQMDVYGHAWELVTFTDDIIDGAIYGEFIERKKMFIRAMGGVFEKNLIPVAYKSKITISSGSLTMDEMVELLFYLRGDKSVVSLTLKSEKVDESIIRGLTELFKADKRKWRSVTLQLSGSGPGKPGSPEHTSWAKAMQSATEDMQKVCSERGIKLG